MQVSMLVMARHSSRRASVWACRTWGCLGALFVGAVLAACGGGTGSTATPLPVTVAVTPSLATVHVGSSEIFVATVGNTDDLSVRWEVNGVTGGNATVGTVDASGVYTAPAAVPAPATVTVSAVSAADPSKFGSVTVTVTPATVISVAVTPSSASVPAGGNQAFVANVGNTGNSGVNWQVNGVAGGNTTVGRINASGHYAAPASVPSPATVTVSAVSVADTTKSGAAAVTITAVSGVSVSLRPSRAAITKGQTQQFTATIAGTANTTVNWSVDGVSAGNASVGTVSASGLFTAPATGGVHTVTATSAAAPAQGATASVAVSDLVGVLTQRYDAARTGQNLKEYALTPATLATPDAFGKLFSCPVDGVTYAQPLYVANLAIGGGTHNVVFVATEHNSVYAFDADTSTCTTYWKRSFLGTGITTVPASDTAETGDIPGEFGITGTPVIDLAGGALYVVANTKESGPSYLYKLHALSLVTGAELANSPKVIQATVGGVTFLPLDHLQRPGLLLADNTVYVVFGSHGDTSIYYGWVLGYDKTSLVQTSAFNTSPNPTISGRGGETAIWMSGAGPAADANSNIYVSTGNGVFDNTRNAYGDSVLKLSGTLAVSDFFTPNNQDALNAADLDLGAGGVLVLPDALGSTAHPRLAVVGDKESKLFLLDRDAMGTYASSGADRNVQTLAVNDSAAGVFTGIFSTPTVWGNSLYIAATNDSVKAYNLSNAQLSILPTSRSNDTYGFPGSNTVVSASGSTGGVLWAIDTSKNGTAGRANGPLVLRAYDASNLATRLWSSDAIASDTGGNAVKFTVPTVANGKVYVAGQTQLTVYGLLP